MKFLLAVSFSLFATASMACTDFSGSYRDDEAGDFTYQQSGCESITRIGAGTSETVITDGKERVISDDEVVRIRATASFVGETLTIVSAIEYKVALPPEVPVEMIPVRADAVHTKSPNGDIIQSVTPYNANGQSLGTQTSVQHKL